MMHLVTYTINPKRDITGLIAELQMSASWCHPIDESWLIVSQESGEQIWNRLAPYLTHTDRVLILEILRDTELPAGWLTKDLWEWVMFWKNNPSGARAIEEPATWPPLPTP